MRLGKRLMFEWIDELHSDHQFVEVISVAAHKCHRIYSSAGDGVEESVDGRLASL